MRLQTIKPRSVSELEPFIGKEAAARLAESLTPCADSVRGQRVVHITADDRCKGGVFEILRGALPYVAGAGVATAWLHLSTPAHFRPALEFFHVLAHGRGPSPDWHQQLPTRTTELHNFASHAALDALKYLQPSDVVVLHDTQAAAIAPSVVDRVSCVVWNGHVGTTETNEFTEAYWDVLGPCVKTAFARIVYRAEYLPHELRDDAILTPPGVDPSLPKHRILPKRKAREELLQQPSTLPIRWLDGPAPSLRGQVALALSRWDPLKDMSGAVNVLGHAAGLNPRLEGLVVGPLAQSDSEITQLKAARRAQAARGLAGTAVHIGVIDQSGTEGHDRAVGLLLSAADIGIQRSTHEAYGLTVTEALLHGAPVIARAVGGIPLQLEDGINGRLIDPEAHDGVWVEAVLDLLAMPQQLARLGMNARAKVLALQCVDRHLIATICGLQRRLGCS
jgi:trehalose synthase